MTSVSVRSLIVAGVPAVVLLTTALHAEATDYVLQGCANRLVRFLPGDRLDLIDTSTSGVILHLSINAQAAVSISPTSCFFALVEPPPPGVGGSVKVFSGTDGQLMHSRNPVENGVVARFNTLGTLFAVVDPPPPGGVGGAIHVLRLSPTQQLLSQHPIEPCSHVEFSQFASLFAAVQPPPPGGVGGLARVINGDTGAGLVSTSGSFLEPRVVFSCTCSEAALIDLPPPGGVGGSVTVVDGQGLILHRHTPASPNDGVCFTTGCAFTVGTVDCGCNQGIFPTQCVPAVSSVAAASAGALLMWAGVYAVRRRKHAEDCVG